MRKYLFIILFIFSVNFYSDGQVKYSSEFSCGTSRYNYIDHGLGNVSPTLYIMYSFASYFGG
ncbi:MAG: hypothetical protein U9N51_00550 [Bacteroidota bacterium]|nr:hypothetical protein [Bacteroidota bacterium]